jgi:hypothetical protein
MLWKLYISQITAKNRYFKIYFSFRNLFNDAVGNSAYMASTELFNCRYTEAKAGHEGIRWNVGTASLISALDRAK